MVSVKEITYGVFGKCVELDNGAAKLVASLDFGPRVLSFAQNGKENMLYNDESKTPLGEEFDIYNGERQILYGGHRLWTAPEIMPRCYHPDNAPCTYKQFEYGVKISGAVEKGTLIQKSMTITMHPASAQVSIVNEILNLGLWEIELAPWSITMMAGGGYSIIPVSKRETGYLPNRVMTFWDYSDLSDPRFTMKKDYITLKQDASATTAFKLGLPNDNGWAAYINKGQIFIKFFDYDEEAQYPDNGSSYESFVNPLMLEMEALGSMVILEPGEAVTLEESWELLDADGGAESDVWRRLASHVDK